MLYYRQNVGWSAQSFSYLDIIYSFYFLFFIISNVLPHSKCAPTSALKEEKQADQLAEADSWTMSIPSKYHTIAISILSNGTPDELCLILAPLHHAMSRIGRASLTLTVLQAVVLLIANTRHALPYKCLLYALKRQSHLTCEKTIERRVTIALYLCASLRQLQALPRSELKSMVKAHPETIFPLRIDEIQRFILAHAYGSIDQIQKDAETFFKLHTNKNSASSCTSMSSALQSDDMLVVQHILHYIDNALITYNDRKQFCIKRNIALLLTNHK